MLGQHGGKIHRAERLPLPSLSAGEEDHLRSVPLAGRPDAVVERGESRRRITPAIHRDERYASPPSSRQTPAGGTWKSESSRLRAELRVENRGDGPDRR